jgi:hypothetical protein
MRFALLVVLAACGSAPKPIDHPGLTGAPGGKIDATGLYQSCDAPLELRFPPAAKLSLGEENGKHLLAGGADKLVVMAFYWHVDHEQTTQSIDDVLSSVLDAGKFVHPPFADRAVDGASVSRSAPLSLAGGGATGAITASYRAPWMVMTMVVAEKDSPRASEVDATIGTLRLAAATCD